jgi:hypothetical protein
MKRPSCNWFSLSSTKYGNIYTIHTEKQHVKCKTWQKSLDVIDSAARDGIE